MEPSALLVSPLRGGRRPASPERSRRRNKRPLDRIQGRNIYTYACRLQGAELCPNERVDALSRLRFDSSKLKACRGLRVLSTEISEGWARVDQDIEGGCEDERGDGWDRGDEGWSGELGCGGPERGVDRADLAVVAHRVSQRV